ncbi:putative tricarboxylic transport membrane protein [Bradyrhizobium sp. CIR48]|uniref:tripartite tricarboxylate transporter TctB family protein n=1 Tax=unclassified Bradyrhizobium TaxID=2631580 RepID=UPI0008E82CEC|nr:MULTISPECIES: tripartite tricarboxylate transporter TctB family protein [unclassified Bradyrhizobium]MBB4377191.1 putative tricarboxylic transport membrane protein [Bradyrhizobium sp. SBR1B]MBB4423367.1 putative tricarboxylic transport membrane protein [Bradyrhizobium sp. CIR48]SFM62627.1 putative tricarboxylic transport membrane protein [Bradyrhizobium sp. Rc3b]
MSDNSNVKFRPDNTELWGGLIGLGLGLFVIRSGLHLKLGTIHDPGSGFVLFYTGILMCAFAATIIVAALADGGPTFGARWKDVHWAKPVIVIACLIMFAFALDPFGFLLSSIPLMLLLMRLIDPVRWVLAVPISVLVPVGMWWLLKHGLGIQLPSGMFEIG